MTLAVIIWHCGPVSFERVAQPAARRECRATSLNILQEVIPAYAIILSSLILIRFSSIGENFCCVNSPKPTPQTPPCTIGAGLMGRALTRHEFRGTGCTQLAWTTGMLRLCIRHLLNFVIIFAFPFETEVGNTDIFMHTRTAL